MFQFCRLRPVQLVHVNVDEGKLETRIFTYPSLFLLLHNSIIMFPPAVNLMTSFPANNRWNQKSQNILLLEVEFSVILQRFSSKETSCKTNLFACSSFVACERRHISIASLVLKKENWRPEKRLRSQASSFFKAQNKRLQWYLDNTNNHSTNFSVLSSPP